MHIGLFGVIIHEKEQVMRRLKKHKRSYLSRLRSCERGGIVIDLKSLKRFSIISKIISKIMIKLLGLYKVSNIACIPLLRNESI